MTSFELCENKRNVPPGLRLSASGCQASHIQHYSCELAVLLPLVQTDKLSLTDILVPQTRSGRTGIQTHALAQRPCP